MSNLTVLNTQFCCGMMEMGNFEYIDKPGQEIGHFHKVAASWKSVDGKDKKGTTKEEILEKMKYLSTGGIIASTGKGQEYVEPILAEIGFKHVYSFKNPGHYQTEVKVWMWAKTPLPLAEKSK